VVREVNTLTLALRDPTAPMDYAASGYYILQVNRTWKGPLVDEVRLWVGEPHAPCGLLLTLGQEYLIYGNLTPMADMEAAGCSRVLSGLEAYYDTWYLGRGVVRPSVQ
jgi:hypothetical protein